MHAHTDIYLCVVFYVQYMCEKDRFSILRAIYINKVNLSVLYQLLLGFYLFIFFWSVYLSKQLVSENYDYTYFRMDVKIDRCGTLPMVEEKEYNRNDACRRRPLFENEVFVI